MASLPADVREQLRREDVEALLHDRLAAAELGVLVAQRCVVEVGVAGPALGSLRYAVRFSEMKR